MDGIQVVFKVLLSALLTISLSTASVVHYSRGKEKRLIQEHRNEHHPIINALFGRDIRKGQSVEDLLAGWHPSAISKHDNFTTLYYVKDVEEFDPCCVNYIISIRVIAMDDELIKAVAIEGILAEIQYAFFNGFDRATEDDYWTSRLRYATAKK